MTADVLSVGTDTDQEKVARTIQRYDFRAVPVVDLERRLVGIVTVDDVIDVIEQEATRDLYAAGAVRAGDGDYFPVACSPWRGARWSGSRFWSSPASSPPR